MKSLRGAFDDVKAFHAKFGATIGETLAVREPVLRARLIREEGDETVGALLANNLPEVVDGCLDVIYVALGTLVACGLDGESVEALWQAVQTSNMAKEGGATRDDGKILKPEGWTPPDIAGGLRAAGWTPGA